MAERKTIYAYSKKADFDDSLRMIRNYRQLDFSNSGSTYSERPTMFVRITEVVNTYEGKGEEYRWDSDQEQFTRPTEYWKFDSDNITNDMTLGNIMSPVALAQDDYVEVYPYDDDGAIVAPLQWMARKQATGLTYIEITGSTNISTYTGSIFDNPTTRTAGATGVTVKMLAHDAGTMPNSASGQGLWCTYDAANSVYYPINYSVFYA